VIEKRQKIEGLLLAFPLRAALEHVLARLDLILAPPARGVWASRGPVEVRQWPVEARGETLVSACHRGIRLVFP